MFFWSSSALKLKVEMVRVWPSKGLASAMAQDRLKTSASATIRERIFFIFFSSSVDQSMRMILFAASDSVTVSPTGKT